MTREIELPQKEIIVCGKVNYVRAPTDHNLANLAVYDDQYTALMFKVGSKFLPALSKPSRDRTPFEVQSLVHHLLAPIRDHVEVPMMKVIAQAFDVDDIHTTWTVMAGYLADKEGAVWRTYVLKPPKGDERDPYEYVTHLLRGKREGNEPLNLEFAPME